MRLKRQRTAFIDTPKVAPQGDPIVGQHTNGEPIYKSMQKKFKRVPLVINGVEQWRKAPGTGEPVTQRMRLVPDGFEEREYVLIATGDGGVFKNFNFRQSPEEIARKEHIRKTAEIQGELASALAENNITVQELVATIKDLRPDDKPKKQKAA